MAGGRTVVSASAILTLQWGTGFMLGVVRTGELAARAAVGPQTLRYYERRGLLAEPVRSPSGYRAYPEDALHRVRFIKRAQELGFTLTEVAALCQLAEGGPDSCDRARAVATEKITDLRRRIADLRALQNGLTRLVATCDLPRAQRECPILHELEPEPDGPVGARGGRR